MKCDVLVLGGGGAGLSAAVAAARAGAHTVLVERHGALGGMAVAALVHS
ncbi:MAG: FAD-dependent oxidoreductase, partial [Gammaproteobacteria bacterium]